MSDQNPPGNPGTNVTVALSGLLTGMFVAAISSTVVVTSLPVIVPELGGGQASYTWIATATLLAMTVSTPIWGKLADLFDRRQLFEAGIALLVIASLVAGLADNLNLLIAMRVVQGVGAGGLAALSQIILADIISPRERGRYAGRIGAALTSANILGPLVGGLITDTAGWRWNFYLVLPVAVAALIMVRRSLHLPARERKAVTVDYAGATLISAGIGLFLIWLTAGGAEFGRTSTVGWLLLAAAGACLGWAVRVELRAPFPLIPPAIFRDTTVSLSVVASLATGAVMFSSLVYLPQYFQFARGASAVMSGLMTIPVMLGLMVSTTVVGRLITRSGTWKPYLIGGGVLLVVGVGWLAQLRADTPYATVAAGMLLLGAGVGALLQNLVVITQNAVSPANIGAATAAVTFFRSLGGAIGIAALGAFIQTGVAERVRHDAATLPSAQRLVLNARLDQGGILDPGQLPDRLGQIAAGAYGTGVGALFLILVAAAFVVLAAVVALPPAALSRATAVQASAGQPVAADSRGGRRWHGDTFLWTGDTILLPVVAPSPTSSPAGAPGERRPDRGVATVGDGWHRATRRQAAPSWAAETAEWPLVQIPGSDPYEGYQPPEPAHQYAIRHGGVSLGPRAVESRGAAPTIAVPRVFRASARVE
ncbi:MFS transporter [Dactylosporangium sp. NPDC050688]|uniref:MDR family MFS transporter n=1 Tax=Dactylosporangium sp. NPDC050688 TaxID=3157217 RepID=UPI0033DAF32C